VQKAVGQLSKIVSNTKARCVDAQELEELGLPSSRLVYVNADIYQASILNLLLPKGYKIESSENVLKAMLFREQGRKTQ